MGLRSWLAGLREDEGAVRSEIWRLGNAHRGEPLEGARQELNDPGTSVAQALLLRACIRRLEAH
jgi:hypothetical protein